MQISPILPIVVTAVVLAVFPHCAARGFAQNEPKKEPGQTVEKRERSDSNQGSLARATLKKAREKLIDYKSKKVLKHQMNIAIPKQIQQLQKSKK